MIKYVVYYADKNKDYVRTDSIIKTERPFEVGKFVTYNQLGIKHCMVRKLKFTNNEFRIYIDKNLKWG